MGMTALAAGMLMAAYFLLLYAGVGLIQEKRFFGSVPKEVFDAVPARKEERFRGDRGFAVRRGGRSRCMGRRAERVRILEVLCAVSRDALCHGAV